MLSDVDDRFQVSLWNSKEEVFIILNVPNAYHGELFTEHDFFVGVT